MRTEIEDTFKSLRDPMALVSILLLYLGIGCLYGAITGAPDRSHAARSHDGSPSWAFVSSISTDAWRADPEVGGGAEEHVLSDTGTMRAGLTRFTANADPDPPPWVLPLAEVLLVLEGEARIEIEGGPTLELKPGDMASLPKGAATRWHLTHPFKELWVLASA